MSADKHRSLAIRVGYLRAASGVSGLGLNVKWARKLTPFLRRMIEDGEIVLRRCSHGGRKRITTAHATPKGLARLAAALQRHGPDFGPISSINRIEPICEDKATRRARLRTPEEQRAILSARRQVIAKRMEIARAQLRGHTI